MSKIIAFIGLGVMGFPMAGHLADAGYTVRVYNRTQSKSALWLERFAGTAVRTPEEAADGAEVVLACVGNDSDLKEITLGRHGAFHGMNAGSVFVDHTTTSAKIARFLHEEAARIAVDFIDAPVSGGQSGAECGRLTIMAGGAADAYGKVEEILQVYAVQLRRMGEAGSGQLTKMVNQICIAGVLQGLAEGVNFARNSGLNIDDVIEVISKGAAQSWQMENRYQTMIAGEYDHGFAVDLMRKDLSICLDEARTNGSSLPVTALVDQFYRLIQNQGGDRWDTSSLLTLLER